MIKEIKARTILSYNKHPSSWFGVKYGMNIYRGCSHGCIYCDSRSECYQIENFDDILVKINAAELLTDELSKKRKKGTIGTGAMSDPYMPVEKSYNLTRKSLEIICQKGFPIHITTKSNLILRDVDILTEINKKYASIAITLTTTDDDLASKIEPYAPSPTLRLKAIGILSTLGITTGVTMMPILPFIEDNEKNIKDIVEKAKDYGASFIYPSFGMTLRDRQREYYYNKLDENFPYLRKRYEKKFGNNYGCGINNYYQIKQIFYDDCRRYSISTDMPSYDRMVSQMQLSLFD